MTSKMNERTKLNINIFSNKKAKKCEKAIFRSNNKLLRKKPRHSFPFKRSRKEFSNIKGRYIF